MLKRESDGNVMKAIPSYYDSKVEERKNAELARAKELRAIFEKALAFYNDNYPKSFQGKHNYIWDVKKGRLTLKGKKIFFEELKELSVEEKLLARYILLYSLKERNYKKISTFNKFNELRGRLRKLIPGGKLLEKIELLEEEKQKKDNVINDLKAQYTKEVELALLTAKNSETVSTKVECPECGKVCNSPAGLASHFRNAHKDDKPKTLIQRSDDLTIT